MDREAKMIVQLPRMLASVSDAKADRTLLCLNAYWNGMRGPVLAPGADSLFLSDLAVELSHVLVCYRDDAAFRSEFAGDEVQDLLGFDPTGEDFRNDDPEPILAGLSRGAAAAAASRRPEWPHGEGWAAIALPFVDGANEVSIILAGLVSLPASNTMHSAEIISFEKKH